MKAFLIRALDLIPGESLFHPATTRTEAKLQMRRLRKLLLELNKFNPTWAQSLMVDAIFRDGKWWTIATKIPESSAAYFKKDKKGEITSAESPDRQRAREILREAGWLDDDIEKFMEPEVDE